MSTPDWKNNNSLELVSDLSGGRKPKRQFLVFVVPSNRLASPLLQVFDKHRNFDIAARFYEAPGINDDLAQRAEFVMTGGLSKFHSAALFLELGALAEAYDGYLFLDGDLEFDAAQLNNFLCFARAAKLDLAQPSVTRDSYCYWKMAYHQPGYIFRETSFVEVMAPYLSRAALGRTYHTFKQSISTYGLDLVWPSLIRSSAIGVVDAFQIRHRDRVDHAAGNFYRYLKSIGVDLDEEERMILNEYGVIPGTAHSHRGYYWKKSSIFSHAAPRLVSVSLAAPERATQRQIRIDIAMSIARLLPSCKKRPEDQLATAIGPFLSGDRISASMPE